MHNFFVEKSRHVNEQIQITGTDVNHIKNVLRLKLEEKICVHIKGEATKYICQISNINHKQVNCNILEKKQANNESSIYINIVQALPKSDKWSSSIVASLVNQSVRISQSSVILQ